VRKPEPIEWNFDEAPAVTASVDPVDDAGASVTH
jgi:ATP-dependent Lon protease